MYYTNVWSKIIVCVCASVCVYVHVHVCGCACCTHACVVVVPCACGVITYEASVNWTCDLYNCVVQTNNIYFCLFVCCLAVVEGDSLSEHQQKLQKLTDIISFLEN